MSALGSKLRLCEGGRVMFRCPGCNQNHVVLVNSGIPGRDWSFNGKGDTPTFTPSVLVTWEQGDPPVTPENLAEFKKAPWPQSKVKKVCHSFVTDGRIQFLTDCTHALAGQTVDLPDFPGEES